MKPRTHIEPLLTPEDVADILHLSPRTVLKLARRDGLACLRFGTRIRFRPDEVAAWLKSRGGGR